MALPIVVMLIVGMVSAGVAYNHKLSLTHSTREAGRYAATLPVTNFASMDAWLDEVATQAIADSTGSLAAGAPGFSLCVAYVHPLGGIPTDTTRRRLESPSGMVSYDNSTCFADTRPNEERRVQIAEARESNFTVVFFSTTLTLSEVGVTRFEAGLGF